MNDNCPVGSNTPDAPWNQSDPKPQYIDVTISMTLSRNTTIEVNDYNAEYWEESEPNGEGGYDVTNGIDYDYSNCDLKSAYEEQEYTIPELLAKLKDYATKDLETAIPNSCKGRDLKRIIKACEEWVVDDYEVVI